MTRTEAIEALVARAQRDAAFEYWHVADLCDDDAPEKDIIRAQESSARLSALARAAMGVDEVQP